MTSTRSRAYSSLLVVVTAGCWGSTVWGQLGDGTNIQRLTPVTVHQLTGVVKIASGQTMTCGLQANGDLTCWGQFGTQGYGNLPRLAYTNVIDVAIGDNHFCWTYATGETYCRGQNEYGQLGNGGGPTAGQPQLVMDAPGIVRLVAGDNHNLGLTADGFVFAWGRNDAEELGDGTEVDRPSAVYSHFGATPGP